MQGYLFLTLAIALEGAGTAFLKVSDGFTRPWPTAAVAASYLGAFWLLSLTIRTLPVGTAYAIWGGVGIVLAQVIGAVVFREAVTTTAMLGAAAIVGGVALMHLGGAPH